MLDEFFYGGVGWIVELGGLCGELGFFGCEVSCYIGILMLVDIVLS